MTLEEAIKRLNALKGVRNIVKGFFLDDLQAIQLGIEALEKERNMRMCHKVLHPADHCELPLLPSETE